MQRLALGRAIGEELAERIFAAAFALFAEKGFERTTMDEVASRAGVARATLYYHFRGKDDLFQFLIGRAVDTLAVALEEAAAPAGSGRRRLERVLDRLVELLVEFRDVLYVTMQLFGRIESQPEEAHQWMHDRSTATLRAVLKQGAADGSLRAVDPDSTALAIFGSACWLGLHVLHAGEDVPAGRIKRQMRALVVEGLGVR